MTKPLLTYENLGVSYGSRSVLKGVSLCLGAGEILGVVGESGSGKTTLLNAAMGLLPADAGVSGRIMLGDEDLLGLPAERLRELRGARIGLVFQDCRASLTPTRTIESQAYEAVCAHARVGRPDKQDVHERLVTLLELMLLASPERILASYPFELSGGMGQRVGIALAMLLEPDVILADEPTSALDVVSRRQVLDSFVRLKRESGAGILLVSHDLAAVRAVADRVAVIQDACIVEQGTTAQVMADPQHPYTRQLLGALPSFGSWGGR